MIKALSVLSLALACWVSTFEARAQEQDGTPRTRMTFAVVIGNNKSLGARRPDLHYADDDAARYFEILETLAPGRVSLLAELDRDTRRLFPQLEARAQAPTRANLIALAPNLISQVKAANRAGHETELYFVFAGHGDVAQGEGFIELADARLPSNELEGFLRAVPFTRAHVILDSCNSFFMLGVRKPGGRHFVTSEDAARSLAGKLPNVGVFLSTSAEGDAFEWSEIQSGIFSHVVRSGMLGAADANGDGAISYLELAGFVDTATADVRNPNMRPHVFARGPGGVDDAPIALLNAQGVVRRFKLSDAGGARVRLRDVDGLVLLDAHAEPNAALALWLPEAWASGAVLEVARAERRSFHEVPDGSEPIALASLHELAPRSAVRGPDETFATLFTQAFGPLALTRYVKARDTQPPPIYGVSKIDVERMQFVLDELGRVERNKRLREAIGGFGFGALLVGTGIGVLRTEREGAAEERREARWVSGSLLGVGGLFVLGSSFAMFVASPEEKLAEGFRGQMRAGNDPRRAFAEADKSLQKLMSDRRGERLAAGFAGALVLAGSVTGLVWSEVASDLPSLPRRIGWSAGMLAGCLLLADAVLEDQPSEILARVWREDPSLSQYHAGFSMQRDGFTLALSGSF